MSIQQITLEDRIRDTVRDIPDFPKPGILFKDITPLLGDAALMKDIVARFADEAARLEATSIGAVESRGFLFGMPLAMRLDLPFFPVRKVGKLPYDTHTHTYDLEYGTDTVEIHTDAVAQGDRVILVDDLLATGGTLAAATELVRKSGAEVVSAMCVVELGFLDGREKLGQTHVSCLVSY